MKLKVLAGSKVGTEIPLKRSKFLIGRSSECTLRAGSDAISRRHCVLLTTEKGVSVRDLGSRNGTLVNGKRIEGEVALKPGDKVTVGPLEFEMIPSEPAQHKDRKPKVKNVAEAVDRAAVNAQESSVLDDDISRWLLGPEPSPTGAMKETTSFRVDETRTTVTSAPKLDETDDADDAADSAEGEAAEAAPDAEADDKKKDKKSRYGKLPKMPTKPSAKDSREAAADILREMSRRR